MAQVFHYEAHGPYATEPLSSSPTSTPASPWPTSPYSHGEHSGGYLPPAWAWGAQSRSQLDLTETAEPRPKCPTAWHEPPRPARRLNRKLPPLMTESLEQLVLATPHISPYTESLRAVPENAPPVPLRSPVRQLLAQQQQAVQRPELNRMDHYAMPKTPSNTSLSAALHTPPISRASSESASWQEHVVTPLSSGALHRALAPEAELRNQLEQLEQLENSEAPAPAPPVVSDVHAVPDVSALLAASDLRVVGEDGTSVRFGDIVSGTGRTLVVFTRHWLSPLCAQYLHALIDTFTPDVVAGTRARVIIVGHGSPAAIRAVKRHFRCPFPIYSDPSRSLYATLGLFPRATGPAPAEPYTYSVGNALTRVLEALALAARIGAHGHGLRTQHTQLGGELVFDGSLSVVLAHRMAAPGDRSAVHDLVAAVDGSRMTFVPKRRSVGSMRRRTPKASISSTHLATSPDTATETAASAEESAHFYRQRASLLLARRGRARMASAPEIGVVHVDDVDAVAGEVRPVWPRSMSA